MQQDGETYESSVTKAPMQLLLTLTKAYYSFGLRHDFGDEFSMQQTRSRPEDPDLGVKMEVHLFTVNSSRCGDALLGLG